MIRLWDTLLADRTRFSFLRYFALAMARRPSTSETLRHPHPIRSSLSSLYHYAQLLSIRDEIIDADDFAFTVKALQHYDNRLPIHTLIRAAQKLYADDGKGSAPP